MIKVWTKNIENRLYNNLETDLITETLTAANFVKSADHEKMHVTWALRLQSDIKNEFKYTITSDLIMERNEQSDAMYSVLTRSGPHFFVNHKVSNK